MAKPVKFAMLRIKNEGRWIEKVIRSIQPICEHIIVLDDSSEDDTVAIVRSTGATVIETPFAQRGFIDETADKDFLLEQVWAAGAEVGDYVLCIDGDEMLHPNDGPAISKAVASGEQCLSFWIQYLWDREDQADGARSDVSAHGAWRELSLLLGTGSTARLHLPCPDSLASFWVSTQGR